MSSSARIIDSLLRRDPDNEDAHELSEEARGNVRHNSMTFVFANGLQNIADQAAKASTVLPWVISATGAPAWMTGLLVPIRESGSMLPQAALQPWVRSRRTRAGIWIAGAIGQAAGVALIAFAAAALSGAFAGFMVLFGLAIQAVARSLNSIASKDIQGRTMPKGLRGRVSGLSTMISGLVAITVGLAIRLFGGEDLSRTVLALLIGGAAVAFLIGALVFRGIREGESEAVPMSEANSWVGDSWKLFTHDAPFRRFVIVRSLLLVSALAPPFVVALSAERSGASMSSVATFIVASGLAALLGGRVSGVVADRSSRLTMIVGAAAASIIIAIFIASTFIEPVISQWWWGPVIFFLLTLIHTGVRVGRKTYVVDMAEGDQRTQYVAVSNTAMGVILLIAGAISSGLTLIGPLAALIFLGALGVAGVLVGQSLEEVSVGHE